jgi:hypothetical protein
MLLSEAARAKNSKLERQRAPTKAATERIVTMKATEKLSNKTIAPTRPTKLDAGTISPNSVAYSKCKKTEQFPQTKTQTKYKSSLET